ncbi:glycosyl hydrolase family 18 protein [Cytobacillus spongiae]|uniref:glycosyl hydrolase family 18 protein n=1 Tax=Cytobacillus spongiae TaxID=2901381 RepID=UPI001F3080F8|nr:glycosyl hydrolase family 18 protein [Cytobacillus spongiae]UII55641.1 glycosyl hydrolase family 18 protein [Cytobacillus spongiae]
MKVFKALLLLFAFLIWSPMMSQSSAQTNLYNMSYLFFGSPTSYLDQVNQTKGSLQVVSPNYFDILPDGSLSVTWKLQTSFITKMHNKGIKVVPFLANHWDMEAGINGLIKREQLAKDIAAAIEKYNLDGVDVDIEGVGSTYRDAHTDFIRLLRSYIPKHKDVSVAVAANPNDWKTGWHGLYDYKALSTYANYLMIMAYDESWESPESPIGPVSSISFAERSIQYAINQGVPKSKIVYGIPFYGRLWKLNGPTLENKQITGMGITSERITELLSKFNGQQTYDEITESASASFTIPKGQSFFIGTTKLTEGPYVIWSENERSLKAKLRLPKKYGIKGTGSWSLYLENPKMWDYYSLWLNGLYFRDVSSGYWAEPSIHYVSQAGWMVGKTSTTFAIDSTLTRAEGAVIIIRALGYDNYKPQTFKFNDVKGHWAQHEIETARELGFLHGKKENQFGPGDPLTREQLTRILFNIFSYPIAKTDNSPFPDLDPGRWSYESIVAVYQQGYIGGFKDGTFRPTAHSTRAQMAEFMYRMRDDILKIQK